MVHLAPPPTTTEDDMTITANPDVIRMLGTPNWRNETRSDFDDLVATLPKRYVAVTDHTRIVPGATDLKRPGTAGGTGSGQGPAIPYMGGHAIKDDEDTTLSPRDLRSERQIEVMDSLLGQLRDLDYDTFCKARDYTAGKTERGTWTPGRGGNASDWIGRMIAKVRELKARPVAAAPACYNCATSIRPDWCSVCREATPVREANVEHNELIIRNTKTGKPMPQYYAVEIDGVLKFYRIKAGTKPGWWFIDAQASEAFHSVRNVATKNNILRAIVEAGPEACMRRYGNEIGNCGRCHRLLTDATSRAKGIGPECEGKLDG